jgi:hypothetical protein
LHITEFHATYYAHQLTRHSTEDSVAALATTLKDTQVDLHPNQIEEQDKIDDERNRLIEETKKKLAQRIENRLIFTVRWRVV